MKSIQTRFVTLILACVFVVCAAVGGTGLVTAQRAVNEDAAQIMNLMCEEKLGELDAILSRVEQSAVTLADHIADDIMLSKESRSTGAYETANVRLKKTIKHISGTTDEAMSAFFRVCDRLEGRYEDLFWNVSEGVGGFLDPEECALRRFIPEVRQVQWFGPVWDNVSSRWVISYLVPVFLEEGTYVGIAGVTVDSAVMERVTGDITTYQSGYAFLTDDQGSLVYHHAYEFGTPLTEISPNLESMVKELEKDSSGDKLFFYGWKGIKNAAGFRTLRNGMHLVVAAPTREIYARRNSLLVHNISLLVGISILAAYLTVLCTQKIIQPLKELDEAAKCIAEGDLSVEISAKTKDEVGALAASLQRTVDYLRQHIGDLNGMAYRDAMTGVKNKAAYLEAAEQMQKRMKEEDPEFGLVMLDVNYLKETNNNYGHDYGDRLIIDGCQLICKTFKHSPVYRFGGDEFVVILENQDLKDYRELFQEFEENLEAHNKDCNPKLYLSIARGIAVYNKEDDADFNEVFRRADWAMYENKSMIKRNETWRKA